ncbi:MAG: T9SS type A sorting domain-containing protein [Saprospiraceae bacterium]|nr:T9SS type A sorting domain-containing protein [Saprospiraceae bacterium]
MVRENDAAKVGRHGGEVGDFRQGVGVINVTDAFWPNPTSDFVNVTFSENQTFVGNASLVVADVYGKVMARKELEHADWIRNVTLNLNEIPAGGYFLILDTEAHGRTFQRFVVLR